MSKIITLKELFESGELYKGDWISRPTYKGRKYTIKAGTSGCEVDQHFVTKKSENILCRFIDKKNENLQCVGRVSDFEVVFQSFRGFENGANELNHLCQNIYNMLEYGILSCSIDEEKLEEMLANPKNRRKSEVPLKIMQKDKIYWLATQSIRGITFYNQFGMKVVDKGNKTTYDFCNPQGDMGEGPYKAYVCPWHYFAIKSPYLKVLVDKQHNGMSPTTPYKIVLEKP